MLANTYGLPTEHVGPLEFMSSREKERFRDLFAATEEDRTLQGEYLAQIKLLLPK